MKLIKWFIYPLTWLWGHVRPYNRVKTRLILQQSATECGIVTLAILFDYYKVFEKLEVLREKCGISRDGCKAATLIDIAQEYGFDASGYRVHRADIFKLTEPVIAYWGFNHYVVIEGVGTNKIFINDPACGNKAISIDEFDKLFTGIIIFLQPTHHKAKLSLKASNHRSFYHWMISCKNELVLTLGFTFALTIATLFYSAISNLFVELLISTEGKNVYVTCLALITIVSFIGVAAIFLQKQNEFKLLTKVSLLKTSAMLAHALRLPVLFYAIRDKTDLVFKLVSMETVIQCLYHCWSISFTYSALMMTSMITMLMIDHRLTLLSISLTAVICLALILLSKHQLRNEKKELQAGAKIYSYSLGLLKSKESIQLSGLELPVFKRWLGLFYQKINIQTKLLFWSSLKMSTLRWGNHFSLLIILSNGAKQVSSGAMSLGMMATFNGLYLIFSRAMMALYEGYKEYQSAQVFNLRIDGILESSQDARFIQHVNPVKRDDCHDQAKKPKHDVSSQHEQTIDNCDIFIDNASFKYSRHAVPTLKNIQLHIKAGDHIALVGSSGSGKSTLVKLLAGLYPATQGNIILGQKNIDAYSADEISKTISYMSQENVLFAGTILQNLVLWNQHYSQHAILQAIKLSELTSLIAHRGIEGNVLENGDNFSGGEKQRMELARVLLQDTPILILDEATAALDEKTEMNIINNLREMTPKKTVIFVAHRLFSIAHCQQILVLHDGEIVERGMHHDLLARRGRYHALFDSEKLG